MTALSPQPSLRSRLRSRELVIAAFSTMGSATASEVLARAGFDCVVVDLEHGLGSEATFVEDVRAVEAAGASTIARIEEISRLRASRPLDHGAAGIIFPRVESAEEAAAAVSYVRYPPQGKRGVALSTRSSAFGGGPGLAEANDRVACIVQIETGTGLANVGAIAGVDGIDMLFVGPTDLSYSLGVPGALQHPDYLNALEQIVAAAADADIASGIMIRSAESLEPHLRLGVSFFILGADSEFLTRAARAEVEAFRTHELVTGGVAAAART